jgi:hypothetical protein
MKFAEFSYEFGQAENTVISNYYYYYYYGSTALCWALAAFSVSLSDTQLVGILGCGDQPIARPLPTHRTTQTQNKRTQYRHPCLEWDSNP